MDKKYQIFISSTYVDLIDIRRDIARSVLGLTEIPAAMEDFGAIDQNAISYIKSVIDKCDYYILIIVGRYGSADDSGTSYTEQEYDYAVEKKKTILAFIRKDLSCLPLSHVEIDPITREKLDKFRGKASSGRLVKFWDDPQELQTSVVIALNNAFRNFPGVGWVRADDINRSNSVEINKLEFENQLLKKELEELRRNQTSQELENDGIFQIYKINIQYFSAGVIQEKFVGLEWLEIYKIIAPLIRRYVKINLVRSHFSTILISTIQKDYTDFRFAEISSATHEEIELFFMGRELVEIRNQELLYLTGKGLSFLLSLKSTKLSP